MKTLFRALPAVALLVGFYVMAVGLAAGLIALDVVMMLGGHFGIGSAYLLILSVPVITTLARGVFMIGARSRYGDDLAADDGACRVIGADQPGL